MDERRLKGVQAVVEKCGCFPAAFITATEKLRSD
jgi:hypothetical protein